MPVPERLFVLAGSHKQSEYWRKHAGVSPREWIFLHDPRQLAGTQQPRYIRIGTWWDLKGIEAIEQQLAICGAVEVGRE